MTSLHTTRHALALLAGVALFAGCMSPLHERSWVEVRTENVVIWSALSERSATELALELEDFRGAVSVVTSVEQIAEWIPTHI